MFLKQALVQASDVFASLLLHQPLEIPKQEFILHKNVHEVMNQTFHPGQFLDAC
jgi:hypothetical protein